MHPLKVVLKDLPFSNATVSSPVKKKKSSTELMQALRDKCRRVQKNCVPRPGALPAKLSWQSILNLIN